MKFFLIFLLLSGFTFIQACEKVGETNECNRHGICELDTDNSTYCECSPGFIGSTCDYEQKSQQTAFWLSILLGGVGADRFYLGYTGLGILKLIFGVLIMAGFIYICTGFCRRKKREEDEMGAAWSEKRGEMAFDGFGGSAVLFVICVVMAFILGAAILWLHDWLSIFLGDLDDAEGMPLYENL